MRVIFYFTALLFFLNLEAKDNLTDQALEKLKQGNLRYVHDSMRNGDLTSSRRQSILSKQNPFAVIVGCSDSRVPPEIIFDQGLGDLFTIRVAGNVVGDLELESILYAAKAVKTPLILVLGHQNCGAVKAVLEGNTELITNIANLIEPAIARAKTCKPPVLNCAIKYNVTGVVHKLLQDKSLAKMVSEKKLNVVGAYYNLDSGVVEFGL
jgi:carbonic anhydrase